MTRHICVSAGERIAELSPGDGGLSAMLSELAEVSPAVEVRTEKGRRYFAAGSCCGFARFTDGTLLEILPHAKGGTAGARRALCEGFCRRCGASFSPSAFDPEINFMEFFISVFAGETMKIIKSGVLSAYASREENMTSVQGTILFAENIRRNLVHRERLYVRHEVFTPDRAENRIIKAAAAKLKKLTESSHSSHQLMEALSFLDEAVVPGDVAAEFGKCVNTRNAKKYSTVLSICRMLFDKNEGTAFTGKYIACAQFFTS